MKKGLLYFAWLAWAVTGAFTLIVISWFVPCEQIPVEVPLISLAMPSIFLWLYKDTPPSE